MWANQSLKINLNKSPVKYTYTNIGILSKILSNMTAKFLFTLCHQFMKSFWNVFWVLYGFPSSLTWKTRCLQKPNITLGLGQRLQEADGRPLPSGRVNSPTQVFSTMAWSLGSSIRDELLWKASQKVNAATLTACVKFLHSCRLQGSLNEGEEQQAGSQTLQKLQDTRLSVLNWRPSPRTMEPAKGWVGLCVQPSFLGWHRCYPDGIKQLRSASRELWIADAPGVLKIHR